MITWRPWRSPWWRYSFLWYHNSVCYDLNEIPNHSTRTGEHQNIKALDILFCWRWYSKRRTTNRRRKDFWCHEDDRIEKSHEGFFLERKVFCPSLIILFIILISMSIIIISCLHLFERKWDGIVSFLTEIRPKGDEIRCHLLDQFVINKLRAPPANSLFYMPREGSYSWESSRQTSNIF